MAPRRKVVVTARKSSKSNSPSKNSLPAKATAARSQRNHIYDDEQESEEAGIEESSDSENDDDADSESYGSVDPDEVGQFEPGDNDEEELWDAVEIVGERPKDYRIKWAGKNRRTKRPWPDSWTLKSNVTNDLVVKWIRWKKAHGVPEKYNRPLLKQNWLAKIQEGAVKGKTTTKRKVGRPRKQPLTPQREGKAGSLSSAAKRTPPVRTPTTSPVKRSPVKASPSSTAKVPSSPEKIVSSPRKSTSKRRKSTR